MVKKLIKLIKIFILFSFFYFYYHYQYVDASDDAEFPYPGINEEQEYSKNPHPLIEDETNVSNSNSNSNSDNSNSLNSRNLNSSSNLSSSSSSDESTFEDVNRIDIENQTMNKKGEIIYKIDESPQNYSFSIIYGSFAHPEIVNIVDKTKTVNYEEIYGDHELGLLSFDLEWQIVKKIGYLGPKFGLIFASTNGSGYVLHNNQYEEAKSDFNLYSLIFDVGIFYRAQFTPKQWIVPYVSSGISSINFIETKEKDSDKIYSSSLGHSFTAGISFLLNVLHPESFYSLELEYGMNSMWLSAEFKSIKCEDKDKNIKVDWEGINIGLTFLF